MNVSQATERISKDLGIHVSESRIRRYETIGLVESRRESKMQHRKFTFRDVEKLKIVVLLAELGIGIGIIKQYFGVDKDGVTGYIKDRVKSIRLFVNVMTNLL